MRKLLLMIPLLLCACTTPKTVLKNEKTGQVTICGGSAIGSFAGGVIGYHIQKSNDTDCVSDYTEEGFKVIRADTNSK